MVRLFLLDIIPSLVFVALIAGTWLYDRAHFLPAGLIYGLLYLVYEKLNRIEFSLSEDMREALLLKTDNRFVYGMAKILLAGGVGAGLYFNEEKGWVDVGKTLQRYGFSNEAQEPSSKPTQAETTPTTPSKSPKQEGPSPGAGKETAAGTQESARPSGEREPVRPDRGTTAEKSPSEEPSKNSGSGTGDPVGQPVKDDGSKKSEPLSLVPPQRDPPPAKGPEPEKKAPAPKDPPSVQKPGSGAPPISDFKTEED